MGLRDKDTGCPWPCGLKEALPGRERWVSPRAPLFHLSHFYCVVHGPYLPQPREAPTHTDGPTPLQWVEGGGGTRETKKLVRGVPPSCEQKRPSPVLCLCQTTPALWVREDYSINLDCGEQGQGGGWRGMRERKAERRGGAAPDGPTNRLCQCLRCCWLPPAEQPVA